MKVKLEESVKIKGRGYLVSFPASIVPTFDHYRSIIPRGRILTDDLLWELQREKIVERFGVLSKPRSIFGFRLPSLFWRKGNLVVTTGKQQIIDLLIAANTNSMTHCGVGSSTQAAAAGDTALITPQGARVAVTDRYRSGSDGKFDTFFNSSHGSNGTTINETGLFTALTGGTMLNRSIVSPGISKTSSNTATIAITVSIS